MATELASGTVAPPAVETNQREAIIFIPGIGTTWDDPSIGGVAQRIAIAIDRESATERAKTRVEVAEQAYGTGATFKCKMFTIVKKDGEAEQALIDVFGLDYNDTLVESYVKRNLIIKTVLLALTLIEGFRRWLFRFYRRGKGLKEKIQLVYGLMIASLLIVYLVILITAVVSSYQQLKNMRNPRPPAEQTQQTTPAPVTNKAQTGEAGVLDKIRGGVNTVGETAWAGIRGTWNFLRTQKDLFPPIIVMMTALGFILPPQVKLKEKISLAATNYLCLIHYLNWGERTHAIGGKLEALIEHLVEKDQPYGKIHIIGYSFGSIVALDNLFTMNRTPINRFRRIDTLVTIGCPFDIIRTYWPTYFNGREAAASDKPRWINVYSPTDILSSNFANGGNEQRADRADTPGIGVEVAGQIRTPESIRFSRGPSQELGILDILTLTGFTAHALYWGEEVEGEITCFHDVVAKIYQGTPVLN